jgi:phage baseplate assembly protein W
MAIMRPHFAVPFRIEGRQAAVVEDGSSEEIRQNVEALLATRTGERLVVPDYGVSDPTFDLVSRAPDTGEIESVVARWEPRASLSFAEPTGLDAAGGEAGLIVRVG